MSAKKSSSAKSPRPDRQQQLAFADPAGETAGDATPRPDGGSEADAVSDADRGELSGKTVYVVDAHSLIYQVFHALPEMTSPTGQPVGAVHGFLRDLVDILERHQPDYLFCAFDHSEVTFRNQLYDQYKAQRESMPTDLRSQIPVIHELLAAMQIAVLSVPGYEADDVLATIATQVEGQGGRCVLVTNDKDCRQLISDRVLMYNIRKDLLYDAAALATDWGIRPDQVVDFQALVGDSVDNVPGVPLFGPKLAKDLITRFETLEGVLNNVDEVAGKKRKENLVTYRDQALLSRDLVRLARDVPLELDWQMAATDQLGIAAAVEHCRGFGFRELTDRLAKLGSVEPRPEWKADYATIGDLDQLDALIARIRTAGRVVVDTETTSTHPRRAEIVGIALAVEPGQGYYVPVRAPEGDPCLEAVDVLERLRPVLEDEQIDKIGQNLKYDMIVLRGAGVELGGRLFDTMVADYLLDPGQRNHGMDELARRYLDHQTIKISSLIGTGRNQKRMDEVPVAEVTPYAAEDADVPLRLLPLLEERLAERELQSLFYDLEMPLVRVLAEMEYQGIRVDPARLQQLSADFGQRLEELQRRIYELAGREFNIDSPQQLAVVLFDELQLPVVKKTKTGRSTDVEVLETLAPLHELPAVVVEYRQYAKLKNTYVDALNDLIHPETRRIHTSFSQDVAATGRLSSRDPNLQNIPIRTETGRQIRSAFIPGEPGWRLLSADYSQIELRVLAHFCGDEALREAFIRDEDIHTRVAAEVAGVEVGDVTGEMRRRAKAINFGIIYGQSPFGLAKALHISKQEAADFIEAYFERYPGVDAFMEDVLAEARQRGSVGTILGRRRPVDGVRSREQRSDPRQRNLPERIAINTVIQGSAADLIKLAMIHLQQRLQASSLASRMLLQIHDELVLEVPEQELAEVAAMVEQEMAGVYELGVPLKVDLKWGENWGEAESIA